MTTKIICSAQTVLVLAATLILFVLTYGATKVAGFKAELFHREASQGSPFYNPNLSRDDIIRRAIARGVNKSRIVTPNGPKSDVFAKDGEYLMKIRLGTPAVDIIGVADTGSELVWTQCATCTQCLPKRNPLYDPRQSTTYGQVECGPFDPPCSLDLTGPKCGNDGFCHYKVRYGDGAYSYGVMSLESLTMDAKDRRSPVRISLFKFGCGLRQGGLYGEEGSGIIGLGPGKDSLVSQLQSRSKGTFAYCLVPLALYGGTSPIYFGDDAKVEGPGTTILPLVLEDGHYHATLEAFTIGSTRVPFTNVYGWVRPGKIIIDSGTSIVLVPKPFFEKIKSALIDEIGAPSVVDPLDILELCFDTRGRKYKNLPTIVANFRGGDVTLKSYNVFQTMGITSCLLFQAHNDFTIYGAVAQANFMVGFDYQKETAHIKHQDCAYH